MYSNKTSINILTSLLVAHGITRIVVCPGSRNAAIIHNLNECNSIACYPVTDERSAGFYALGMALADGRPVAVCVTSGSALLNLAPAVAEAAYRHCGLIVISADRPAAWIGQLDGQTIVQPGVFGGHVGRSVNLPEVRNHEEHWLCNRLINEALLSAVTPKARPVHINVPLSEPLFEFTVAELPVERVIDTIPAVADIAAFTAAVVNRLKTAERPMVVVGQFSREDNEVYRALSFIAKKAVVLCECLASSLSVQADLAVIRVGKDNRYMPDFILYAGDTLVSKRLKAFLRSSVCAEAMAVSADGNVHDTFMNLTTVVEGDASVCLKALASALVSYENMNPVAQSYIELWRGLLLQVERIKTEFEPAYSQLYAVKAFETAFSCLPFTHYAHYANSMAVRLGCVYADHYAYCNRGVNGIEGCLSTAAGFSVAVGGVVFCVIGDLSFFYDQNALWNNNIRGNLRVVLLNNRCGGIFFNLGGLPDSSACERFVAARHETEARGVCLENNISYRSVHGEEELRQGLQWLTVEYAGRPMLLEIFTDADEDVRTWRQLIKNIQKYE